MQLQQSIKIYLFWIAASFSLWTTGYAVHSPQSLLRNSDQLLVVLTPALDALSGQLQRFQRDPKHQWVKFGDAVPVVVGKNGMAWGVDTRRHPSGLIKKEGDGRTPMGIYPVGPAFGFDEKSSFQISYFPLTDTSICVDDEKSRYYNQLIDSSNAIKMDWRSGEKMRTVPLYEHGAVVQYNQPHPVIGGGSCIFLHIWRAPDHGTAGCVAMKESSLKEIISWLNAKKHPVMATLDQAGYKKVRTAWRLPSIPIAR
jgi:D-alanyl-D-alanine dipeptidase